MKRNKEWLLTELCNIDSTDNNNEFVFGYETAIDLAIYLVNQLDEPTKIVIPQFVANEIELHKLDKDPLVSAFENVNLDDWLYGNMARNVDVFARAWLDGYEVEKEKLYLVSSDENSSGFWFLSKDNDGKIMIGTNEDYFKAGWKESKLTEKEIKDYDPRYWQFAVPVEEEK